MKSTFKNNLVPCVLAAALIAHGSHAPAFACSFESESPERFELGVHPDYSPPFGDNKQARGVLALLDDTAQNISSEGLGVSSTSPKMPFVLRPSVSPHGLEWGRWILDIPSQAVLLRFDPVPKAQYISSFQVQKGPRTPPSKRTTEQEYKGVATEKFHINGTWVVVKDGKGLFKQHSKQLVGYIFMTSSNVGSCPLDFVSARVSISTPSRADRSMPDERIEIRGEANTISAYVPGAKP